MLLDGMKNVPKNGSWSPNNAQKGLICLYMSKWRRSPFGQNMVDFDAVFQATNIIKGFFNSLDTIGCFTGDFPRTEFQHTSFKCKGMID